MSCFGGVVRIWQQTARHITTQHTLQTGLRSQRRAPRFVWHQTQGLRSAPTELGVMGVGTHKQNQKLGFLRHSVHSSCCHGGHWSELPDLTGTPSSKGPPRSHHQFRGRQNAAGINSCLRSFFPGEIKPPASLNSVRTLVCFYC